MAALQGPRERQEEMRVAETELTAVVSMTGHVSEAHSLVARLLQMRHRPLFEHTSVIRNRRITG